MKGKKTSLLCSIANPRSFLKTAKNLGAVIADLNFFDDHHEYTENEIADVLRRSRENKVDMIVTTQKDEVKFRRLLQALKPETGIFVLKVAFKILEGEEALHERLYSLYSA